jgi:hypothetical protein
MATTLFTIDRRKAYATGSKVSLKPPDYGHLGDIPLDPAFLASEFPEGISTHGQRYLINWSMAVKGHFLSEGTLLSLIFAELAIELTVELVRRLEFSGRRSRFQGMFGCRDLDELKKFAEKTGSHGVIYEIEAGYDQFEIYDMAFLDQGSTASHAWLNARRYWSKEASTDPRWECLIHLPVTIGRQLETI